MAKRPFRGLRRGDEPHHRYDAVVVGAGVGGLVAANLLAAEGLSVLLVEKHYMAGGYCSTFRRGGFTFDASTHFYPLLGNPETLTGRLLARLGCRTEWIAMDPVDTFHLPDGSSFEVPADFEAYRRRLDARFPEQRPGLDAFFDEVRQAYLAGVLYHFRGRRSAGLERYQALTLSQVLDRHIRDPALRLVLTADAPHWGSPPGRTSFVFDSMLRLSYFLGNYYPRGGSQAFADDLAARFEEAGGHLLMSTQASGIEVEAGRVAGLRLETVRGPLRGRRRVKTPLVLANTDLLALLRELLPPEHVPVELLRQVESLRPSYPCYLTHVGLAGEDPDRLERAQGYYWRDWDAEAFGHGALHCKVFVPTHYDPELAPPGKQIVILQKVMAVAYDQIEDWGAHKAEIESFLLGKLETVLPGIGPRIEVALTASAATARHFTGNHVGAMLGWEMAPDQLGPDRPGVEGPVPGLYFVGHWVRPGGGITPVLVSAEHAVDAALGRSSRRAAEAGIAVGERTDA